MKYRDILGFSKPKKKVVKEQSKSKKNQILESIKKEFGYPINEWTDTSFKKLPKRWSKSFNEDARDDGLTEFEKLQGGKDFVKEVGASSEYRKYTQKIEKSYRKYWDEVKDFEDLLVKKGLKPAAKEIHKKYAKNVLGFQAWLRGFIDRLL